MWSYPSVKELHFCVHALMSYLLDHQKWPNTSGHLVWVTSSLWHNNALQCIEMKSRNFRHNSATSDSDYSTGDISDVGWNLVLAGWGIAARGCTCAIYVIIQCSLVTTNTERMTWTRRDLILGNYYSWRRFASSTRNQSYFFFGTSAILSICPVRNEWYH